MKRTCSSCIKGHFHCREQGEPKRPRGSDPRTRCHNCFMHSLNCGEERPCRNCIKIKRRCREQGEQPARMGQDPQMKCNSCFEKGSKCDGKRPCGFCSKTKRHCEDQEKVHTLQAEMEVVEIGCKASGRS